MKNKRIRYGLLGLLAVALLWLPLQSATNPLQVFAESAVAADNGGSDLQKQASLNHVVKIYVPSTVNGTIPIADEAHDRFVDQALTKFSNLFGGATAIDGIGGWIDGDKKLIKEKVTIVYSFADKLDNQSLNEVVAYAKQLKKDLTQSSVSLEVDGKMYFIE
ncbi:DUF3574 domain-containing protein [Paenibacillus sp. HJGM_3]|uniref:DUF3574 domain-containing protein n=1 Tax=Paenibacillus sp. HJGM_3 TaxID=3379816 RepID=UPI00385C2E69